MEVLKNRQRKAFELLRKEGFDKAIIGDPMSINYLTGIHIIPYERYYGLVLDPVAEQVTMVNPSVDTGCMKNTVKEVVYQDSDGPQEAIRQVVGECKKLAVETKYFSMAVGEYFYQLGCEVMDIGDCISRLRMYKDEKEIEDRFYKNLEFGTGGLRGVIGAGTNRINKYTIRRATYGLANYILNKCGEEGKQKGVVIAYDSRFKSEEFSTETAKTLAACGIKAYIFDSLRTTPQLSFAVRHLGCVAGVVITASHNPPEYNGYKVYWTDGGQVCPNIAEEIIQEVNKIEDYSTIPTTNEENELITLLDETVDRAFIDAVKEQVIRQDIIDKVGKEMKIIFTPIHGTGNLPIRKALDEVGFKMLQLLKNKKCQTVNSLQ